MNALRRILDLFRRKPAMIGTPPSRRRMWPDPAAHARDFSVRYALDVDLAVAERMGRLGIDEDRIGMPDDDRGIEWAAFHPLGTNGGYNSPDGRLVVESGLFNDSCPGVMSQGVNSGGIQSFTLSLPHH